MSSCYDFTGCPAVVRVAEKGKQPPHPLKLFVVVSHNTQGAASFGVQQRSHVLLYRAGPVTIVFEVFEASFPWGPIEPSDRSLEAAK